MESLENNKVVVRFFAAAVAFLGWGVIQGALQAQKPIHDFLTRPPADIIVGAHAHINLLGWVSLSLVGLLYYLVPKLTGKPIAAPKLINPVFWVWVVALALMGALMIAAGIAGGIAWGANNNVDLNPVLAPYMIPIGILSIILALAIVTFIGQILTTICRRTK